MADVNGYTEATFPTGAHPAGYDTDGDGIPNEWEIRYGLNPNSAADSKTYTLDAKKYYTNLEVYLNSIVEHIAKAQNLNAMSAVDEYYPTFVDPTGISMIPADDQASVLSSRFYTLSGMEISCPDSYEGVLIRINTLSNGKTVSTKILNR